VATIQVNSGDKKSTPKILWDRLCCEADQGIIPTSPSATSYRNFEPFFSFFFGFFVLFSVVVFVFETGSHPVA
jgi:hypothetical protein